MLRLLKGMLAHRRRLVHTAAAGALAVSLLSGTVILTDTIEASFQEASSSAPGDIDVIVRSAAEFSADGNSYSEREPLPTSLVATVGAVPGVGSAWGLVWGYAQLVDEHGNAVTPQGLPAVGTAWSPNDALAAGHGPSGPNAVVIDVNTARALGLGLGDQLKVLFHGVVQEFTIEGLRLANEWVSSTLASFELATAQRVLGRGADLLDAVAVRAVPGVSSEALRARLAGVVPGGYEVVTYEQTAKEAKESWTNALGFLTTGLLVFTAISLLVGAFMICNTFSILVAQRSRELGLLRALGASRTQVCASVLAEAAAVGLVSSMAGVALGLVAARGLLAMMGGMGFDLPTTSVVFAPRTAIVGLLSGVILTAVAAILPALRATNVSPMAGINGLRRAPRQDGRRRLALGTGVVLAGAVLLLGRHGAGGQPATLPLVAGAGGLLLGLAIVLPVLARPAVRVLGAPLSRLLGPSAHLGRENAMRNPRRTAATAGALTIGVGLVGVMAIVGASMKASAATAIDETLRADFVVKPKGTEGLTGGVPPVVAERLRATRGVDVVSEIRAGQWGRNGTTETLLAVDPATVERVHNLDPASLESARRLADSTVLVRDTVAERHGWRVGDEVPMTFARTGTQRLRLAGTFSPTTVRSDYVVSLGTFEANYVQQLDAEVRVALAPGVSPAAGRSAIDEGMAEFPTVAVMDRSEVLADQEEQVNRLLLPVVALLVLSIVIALLGIANTLVLSLHERTREIGLLRAIGMDRGQLRSMVRAEAVLMALLGSALGAVVAVVLGSALVTGMGNVGVTELVLPTEQLVWCVAAATLAGLAAGVLPARRAARLGVLEAVSGT